MSSAPATSVALVDGVDVDAVAAAVRACPGVSALFGGPGDVIASYLPGRRVPGVEVSPDAAVVHVRSRWGVTAAALLSEIESAVSPLLPGKRLEVVVADIDIDDSDATSDAERAADPPALPAVVITSVAPSAPVLPAPPVLSAPVPPALSAPPAPPALPTV